ncbi:hypothetical protein [Ruficoccus sp. ZRK36]|uniref:sodium:solute symporter family transporter n=1 Tax=Ruficoccus sp. ZRK36 TaxID=2866311 RepID=UPI001C7368BB|nr:hypothetical protein [Ruficoccus sp. ZRK36]QYY35652.1 hypothetical protein K0V07_15305 [Ruficoccus sp. ZRK36]
MTGIDYAIVAAYLVGLLALGAYLSKRASANSEEYFLGGHKLPWWALGASGMSSNLDVAGTMTIVTLLYVYGLHGFFIEMRGGVVLPIAVFVAFMGKWHRRSAVMTTAEWMQLRFGTGAQGQAARMTAAVTYLVITIGMVVFFLGAAGKFLAVFLPFTPLQCQVGMLLIALVYTMMSGLYGVVWTDVIQSVLIGGAAIYVAVVAGLEYSPALAEQWPGAQFNQFLPKLFDERLATDGQDYRLFGLFLLFWVGKGLLEGLGGSGGSAYMAQRFYAARTPGDGLKIGMLWTLLFAFRWPMVLGFAILAVALGVGQDDPERALPEVLLSGFFPAGVRGIVLAAMLAAAMSTFDSTINAGASYLVKDIWQPLRKKAGQRELVVVGYLASAFIVGTGLMLSLQVESVVDVWVVIVIGLFPAFLVPFALRWYWERFNGAGFSIGVGAGFAAALFLGSIGKSWDLNEVAMLGFITGISLLASVVGTYCTSETPETVRKDFYRKIRPWGLWNPAWKIDDAKEHRGDIVRLITAVIWQVTTFLLPMAAVLHAWTAFTVILILWLVAGGRLLRDWELPVKPDSGGPAA